MSVEQIEQARSLHDAGQSFRAIARELGVSRTTVAAELRAPGHQPEPADRSGVVLDGGNGHASAVQTISQIRDQWALDLAADPDEGWWPPTVYVESRPSARHDLSW